MTGEDIECRFFKPLPGATWSKVWTFLGFRKMGESPPSKSNLHINTII